jgi:hypothetical protein
MLRFAADAPRAPCSKRSPGAWREQGGARSMTQEQRHDRIRALTRELATLYEEELQPLPRVTFVSAGDLPAWLAAALGDALRRKLAEDKRVN